jgi:uncharacterized membrane protein YjjP (DUF1212 family)
MGDALTTDRDRSAPARHDPAVVLELMLLAARLLFVNGQTTERIIETTVRLAGALGWRGDLLPRWGELTATLGSGSLFRAEIVAASPLGIDMGRVAAVVQVVDRLCDGRIDATTAGAALAAIQHRPPVGLARFALLAGAGAAALGVIFGVMHLVSLILIGLSAGAGAVLRRWLARFSGNPFLQPFCAALLAGGVGAIATHLQLSTMQSLVAVCPCMVLVPGPHLLNGAIDLARTRLALGAVRILYASLTIVMICIGLLVGLALGGVTLPVAGASVPVPLAYDVIAAGVAVAAYGTFFDMPWRALPIPIVTGMVAHAARWAMISVGGGSVEAGALVACLFVGIVMTLVADLLRLPFAAVAFASVVSLIPGVFLFRMGGGLVALATLGAKAPPELLLATIADGSTALLIMVAMGLGLILPKMLIEQVCPDLVGRRRS